MGVVALEDALCEVDYVLHSAAVVMASIPYFPWQQNHQLFMQ